MSFDQPHDFREESEALFRLMAPLSDEDFARETQFKGWTFHDVIAHLHVFNWAADLALQDGEAFKRWFQGFGAGMAKGRSMRELTDEWLDGVRGRKLLDVWHAYLPEMTERFAAADPKARVPWAGPDMSVRSSITARLMETWAHGQEVYDQLGFVREDRDRIKNIAHLGVTTFGWTFANRGLEVPKPVPHVKLDAPSGATWEWNPEVEDQRVEGSATEFCQVVTQVRNVEDTQLAVTGDVAQRWMSIAQCFAGAPEEPPPPGTRHTVTKES